MVALAPHSFRVTASNLSLGYCLCGEVHAPHTSQNMLISAFAMINCPCYMHLKIRKEIKGKTCSDLTNT